MCPKAIRQMVDKLGEERVMWLVKNFPNQRLPGSRYIARLKKENFMDGYINGRTDCLTIKDIAHDYDISTRSVYNWLDAARERKRSVVTAQNGKHHSITNAATTKQRHEEPQAHAD